MKAIQTEYKGYLFRSRLEARWAVFFDACGVRWEYEPEGYDLGDGIYYLPDFLFVEGGGREGKYGKYKNATLVVGNIPEGETADEIDWYVSDHAYHGPAPYLFNFETIDGDHFAAHPGINKEGKFELFGDDSSYLCDQDPIATERAYRLARQARFEHGEKPHIRRNRYA